MINDLRRDFRTRLRSVPLKVAILSVGLWMSVVHPAHAQTGDPGWSEPVNLSRSGAASAPVLVTGPADRLRALWWDQFDGITSATFDGSAWSAPTRATIELVEVLNEEVRYTPIAAMPTIFGDPSGNAYALWLGQADRDTGLRPLLFSRLGAGSLAWGTPTTVAESALVWHAIADPAGTLHLLYVRPTQSAAYPAGIYYRRSASGGANWTGAQLLYPSVYLRGLDPQQAHFALAADGAGRLLAAWDDPRLGRSMLSISPDNGQTWSEPQPLGSPEEGSRAALVGLGQPGEALVLWQGVRVAAACALYQQRSTDSGLTWSEPQRVLEGLDACPEQAALERTADGTLLLVGTGAELTLAAWNGNQWSEPLRLGFSFRDPELGQQVYLGALNAAVVGNSVAVVGQGQDNEAWCLQSQIAALEWAFAPPSPWSQPVNISQSASGAALAVLAGDAEGRLHALWSEPAADTAEALPGTALFYARQESTDAAGEPALTWSRSSQVLRTPAGGPQAKADQPALVATGEVLHAVWSGGPTGEIFYSRAYAREAYAPDGWSEPRALPSPVPAGAWPTIVAGLDGALYAAYAAPLNEARGIYVVRSPDGGESWSGPYTVFDAESAGWAMAARPTLAADERGVLHVAWLRSPLPGFGPPDAVYYARSTDGGRTWSAAQQLAEGAYDWPRIAATYTGQVHLLWSEVTGSRGWQQRWSADGGETWSRVERISGFASVAGPAGLVADGAGRLYLAGLGQDDAGQPALRVAIWGGERWSGRELLRLDMDRAPVAGVAVALRGVQGRLDIAFRAPAVAEDGNAQIDVWHTSLEVEPVASMPAPLPTPVPSPTPSPTPAPTPTPRPVVPAGPPPEPPPSLDLGLFRIPLLSLGGLGLAVAIVAGLVGLRSLRARRG